MESIMSFDIVSMNDISSDPSLSKHSLVKGGSFDNALSTVELNWHLELLVTENKVLKENMENKNKMVVELLSKITSWQEKMAETNSEHRSVFLNSIEENEMLKNQTKQLESAVANSKCEMTQLTEETEKLRKELEDQQIVHQKWEDAAKKNETLMVAIQELTEEKQKLSENLQNQQTVHQEAVKELKCELENLQLKCQQVENEKIALDVQNVETNQHLLQEQDEKIEALSKEQRQLEDEKETNASLQLKLAEVQSKLSTNVAELEELKNRKYISEFEEKLKQLTEENDCLKQLLEDFEVAQMEETKSTTQLLQEKDEKTEALSRVQRQLEDEKEASASLQLKLTEVEEKLSANVAELEECKNRNSELENKFQQLVEDKDHLVQLLEENKAEQMEENELISVMELLQQQDIEQLDNLTARLLTTEEELAAERQKVEALNQNARDQVDHSNDEALQLLKAQVQSYKSEYEVEFSAHLCAQQEVTRLADLLRTLKQKIEHSRCHRRKHTAGSASELEMSSISSYIQERTVTCPNCNEPFAPDALEDHMRECVDNFS